MRRFADASTIYGASYCALQYAFCATQQDTGFLAPQGSHQASAYAGRTIPEARGEAEAILQRAKGYRQQTVAEATGQAARFVSVLGEYKKAPDVTRKRLYLETMERVFGSADKIIIDTQDVVPFLSLGPRHKR